MVKDGSCMKLLEEVKTFVEEIGFWPPRHRRGDLGSRIQVFLRRADDAQGSERGAIVALRKTCLQGWSKSVARSRKIIKRLEAGSVPAPGSKDARFMSNLKYTSKKRPASAINVLPKTAVAMREPSKQKARWDLSDAPIPVPFPGTVVHLTPQIIVDYLYQALSDTAEVLNGLCPGRWFLMWGSAIGALRSSPRRRGGLIAWDCDIDIGVLVDRIPWEGYGLLKSRLQQAGHGVHQGVDGHIKVYPPIPYVGNVYHEHFRRAAEEQKQNLVAKPKDLGQLCRLAKMRTANNEPVRKIGRNVVDIDLEQSVGNGNYKLLSMGTYSEKDLLPVKMVPFGPLKVPVAKNAKHLLRDYYGQDVLRKCQYRRMHGGCVDVPPCVPRIAYPSSL